MEKCGGIFYSVSNYDMVPGNDCKKFHISFFTEVTLSIKCIYNY